MLIKYAKYINKDKVCQRQTVTFTTIKMRENKKPHEHSSGLDLATDKINIKGKNKNVA